VRRDVPYSAEADRILGHAAQECARLWRYYAGTEHLLLGLLADEGNAAKTELEAGGADLGSMRELVEEITGFGPPGDADDPVPYTRRAALVLKLAARAARRAGDGEIRGEHILAGLRAEREGLAAQILARLGREDEFVHGLLPSGV